MGSRKSLNHRTIANETVEASIVFYWISCSFTLNQRKSAGVIRSEAAE
jgi:hypothetical protein